MKMLAVLWKNVRAGDRLVDFALVRREGNVLQIGESLQVQEGAVELPFTDARRPNYRVRAGGHGYIGPGTKRVVVLR